MKKYPERLLDKYRAGQCTDEEIAIIESWYNEMEYIADNPEYTMVQRTKERVWESLSLNEKEELPLIIKVNPFYKRLRIAAAAMLFIAVGAGLYFYQNNQRLTSIQSGKKNQIVSIPQKATLILDDGSTIVLDDTQNGKLMVQKGISINKIKGQIVYEIKAGSASASARSYNTIETPKGSQFKVVLPDGSAVWLNAGSSLRYPLQFATNQRDVVLKGEGYFEVSKDKKRPFKVTTVNQQVEVLGTHFNIMAYADQHTTRTTLLEGSVKVTAMNNKKTVLLKPNQQASLSETSINVEPVEAVDVVAWKEGYFVYNAFNLEEVMNGIARWYDIQVVYKDPLLKKELFSGSISHFSNVADVLKKLELTGTVKFIIEGKKVTVLRAE